MIQKILIANRGEIAVRIIRACKEMGITSVAIFSEADRHALHVKKADESYRIGSDPLAGYLNAHRIVNTAVTMNDSTYVFGKEATSALQEIQTLTFRIRCLSNSFANIFQNLTDFTSSYMRYKQNHNYLCQTCHTSQKIYTKISFKF